MHAYGKDILRTLRKEKKRFFAIAVITTLGVMMFSGLQASCTDLRRSADLFFDEHTLHDLEIVSTLGLTADDVEALSALSDTEEVAGRYVEKVTASFADNTMDIDLELLYDDRIDRPYLAQGRMCEAPDETIVSQRFVRDTGLGVGDTFTITENTAEEEDAEEDEEEADFLVTRFTITGVFTDVRDVNNPYGATAYRGGMDITPLAYVLPEAAAPDVYTSVVLTVTDAKELFCFDDAYVQKVRTFRRFLEEEIKEQREEARYTSVVREATEKVDEAEEDVRKELADALRELEEGEEELNEELAKALQELVDAQKKIEEAEAELADARRELAEAEAELADKEQEAADAFAKAHEELDGAWATLIEKASELDVAAYQLAEGESALAEGIAQADAAEAAARSDIATQRQQAQALLAQAQAISDLATVAMAQAALAQIDAGEADLNARMAQERARIEEQRARLSQARMEIDNGRAQIEEGWKEYDEGLAELEREEAEAAAEIADARRKIEDARREIADGEAELADARKELADGYAEYEQAKEEGEQELAEGYEEYEEGRQEAEEEIASAREEIEEIDMATWYIRDRDAMSAFNNIKSDSEAIESIGTVFPVVFFLVAILISLTAVTRMVEVDRGLLGTYKALGFSDVRIRRKYMIFTSAASITGSVVGSVCAFCGLPAFLFRIFDIMYILPGYGMFFLPVHGLLGPLVFILGIVGAAYLTCLTMMRETPASLMRPKSPRAGKRVWLEKVTFLWERLSFLNKVTARNLYRYKKRLLMTVFGIAGCTALLLFGFAIRDSVHGLMPRQYDETSLYDLLVVASMTEEEAEEGKSLHDYLTRDEEIASYLECHITNVKIHNTADEELSVQLIVPSSPERIQDYIVLRDTHGTPVTLSDGDVLVTRNAAEMLSFAEGDEVRIQLPDLQTKEVGVTHVLQYYLGNVVFMTQKTYMQWFEDFETNGAMVMLENEVDEEAYQEDFATREGVLTCLSTAQVKSQFSQTFLMMDAVVAIIIGMSALLAFAVLFTLSTTNISERERELATIKVLGFYDREVHAYVDKETLILTIIGVIIGIPVGYLFSLSLPYILRLPSMYFAVTLNHISYVYAAVLSLVFLLAVNLITDRYLNRIDMVEALKSVE